MDNLQFSSLCARPSKAKITTQPHQLPIHATSSFAFRDLQEGMDVFTGQREGHLYSRFGNPTIDSVAEKLAQLEMHGTGEEGYALLTSSGMAAISTLALALLKPGDAILTQGNLYGGTTELFRNALSPLQIAIDFSDLENLDQVEVKLKADSRIKMVYIETPANPTLACIDIQQLARLAQKYDAWLVADNTFATPYLQRPLSLGTDFVIHSTTKYLNGHGNSIAGAIIGKEEATIKGPVLKKLKLLGTNCNAWDAWLLNNGLKTLALRMDRHCANAQYLAEWLNAHPKVKQVNYPGLHHHPTHRIAQRQMQAYGGMLSFELEGGLEAGKSFIDKLNLCTLAPTLGDVDTLALHPASMSHLNIPKEEREAQGISDGLIRISVGIEDKDDIRADLEQAMA